MTKRGTPTNGFTGNALQDRSDFDEAVESHAPAGRGELIERASHELRNPLANVLGFAHVLSRRAATRPSEWSPESLTSIAMLVSEAERLQTATEAFLELLRAQDGLFQLAVGDIELDQLIHEEVRALGRRWQHLTMNEEYGDTAAVACSDETRLRFVVRAVLDCAARSAGGHPSRVAVQPTAAGGTRVLVYVPVLEAHAVALIAGGDGGWGRADDEGDGELDLTARVTRLIARRLGLTIALARQAGQQGADIVIAIPSAPPLPPLGS